MTIEVPFLPRRTRDAYPNPPALIAKRTTAKSRGWFEGYPDGLPVSARGKARVARPIDDRVFELTLDARLVELFSTWLAFAQELGYPLIGADEVAVKPNGDTVKQGGVGSYFNRPIKTQDGRIFPSNHSNGTAVDLYSRSNPQRWGAGIGFWSTQHPVSVDLAAAADLYWGGWYGDKSEAGITYIDAMHFEYMRRPPDVADSLRKLKARYAALRPEEPDVSKDDVKLLQSMLNGLGAEPLLVVDGDFGPITRAALNALPATVQAKVNAAVAENTTDVAAQVKEAAKEAIDAVVIEA